MSSTKTRKRRLCSLVTLTVMLGCLSGVGVCEDGLVAYRAGRIVSAEGEDLIPGVLLVRGERVHAVWPADRELPEGSQVIDLGQAVITPGMVNPLSAISIVSSVRSRSGRASFSARNPAVSAKAVVLPLVDPEAVVYRRLGRTGYTSIALIPGDEGTLVAGRAAVIKPRRGGETKAKDLMVAETSYLFLGFATGKNWYDAAVKTLRPAAEKVAREREAKKEAEQKIGAKKKEPAKEKKGGEAKKTPDGGKKEAGEEKPKPSSKSRSSPKGKAPPRRPKKAEPDPLVQAFRGEIPVLLRVGSPAAIDHLFEFLDSLPVTLRFVLVTGSQPPDVVEKLAARRE